MKFAVPEHSNQAHLLEFKPFIEIIETHKTILQWDIRHQKIRNNNLFMIDF